MKKKLTFSFACGTYIEETVIPDDRTRTSMFSVLGDKLEEQVRIFNFFIFFFYILNYFFFIIHKGHKIRFKNLSPTSQRDSPIDTSVVPKNSRQFHKNHSKIINMFRFEVSQKEGSMKRNPNRSRWQSQSSRWGLLIR